MKVEGRGSYLPLRVGVDQSFLGTIRNVTSDISGGSFGSFEFLDSAGIYVKGRWESSSPTEIRSLKFSASKAGDLTSSTLEFRKPLAKTRNSLKDFLAKSAADRHLAEQRNLSGPDLITGGQMQVKTYDGDDQVTVYWGKSNVVRTGLGNDTIGIGLTQLVVGAKSVGAGGEFYGGAGVDQWVIGDYQTKWGAGKVIRIKDYNKGELVTIDNEFSSWGVTPGKTAEGWVAIQNVNHPDTRIVFEGITNPLDISYSFVSPLL